MSSSNSYPERDEGLTITERLGEFLSDYYREQVLELAQHYPKEQRSLAVDYHDLFRFDPDIADDYLAQPGTIGDYLDEALAQYDLPIDVNLNNAHVRVENLADEALHDVGQYRPNDVVNSLIGVRGQVTKRSKRQLKIRDAAFECQRCGTLTRVPQTSEDLQEPHECQGCERQGPFTLNDAQSDIVDHQLVRLQTLPENAQGTTTDSIDITLDEDLVGDVRPGDRIVANANIQSSLAGQNKPVLELHGVAQSLDHLETDHSDIDVSPYREEIETVAASANPYEQIIESIAPSHKGDERIKEALAYQLFGGVSTELPDGSTKRGTCHVLLIGDPGSGKSSLIRAVSNLVPRSVYASGKQTTSAGLTAAAVQSDFGDSGEWSLEAGALVEAHNGLAAIDELDKMDAGDQSGMLEAMSEQQITISKAGINATLPASVTILAAANPEEGRFDSYSSIAGQLGLNPVLLSRFDLMFTMADSPDEERDSEIAAHMNKAAQAGQQIAAGQSLDDDLAENVTPTLSPELMRAYVAHARSITPVLTDDAADHIEEAYVTMRQANEDDDDGPVPTTAREIEAVQRLAEASARIRLSEHVEVEDVERVLKVWRACLADLGMDPETHKFDADRMETGQTKTQRDRKRTLTELIEEIESREDVERGVPRDRIIEEATDRGFTPRKVRHELDTLCQNRTLYQPADGHYRVV